MCLSNNRTFIYYLWQYLWCPDSSVGITTGYWLDKGAVVVRVSVELRPDRFGVHQDSYPMGIGCPYPGDKAADV
jgi:hypothetical protein